MNIDTLRAHYNRAMYICDPVEFASRQKQLLYAICDYLIDLETKKDTPTKTKGPDKKLSSQDLEVIKKNIEKGKSKNSIASEMGIARSTLYRYLKDLK
jgi:hypothetical protein